MKKDKRKSNDSIIELQMKSVETKLHDGVFTFSGPLTISDFSEKVKKSSSEVVGHFFKKGLMFNINHVLTEEQIAELCLEYEYDFQKEDEVNAQNFMERVEITDEDEDLQKKPPIITIMGHVDHGKTTLIDKIRNSTIVSGESGGITQHIGAYQVVTKKKEVITFLDTPGHEAFTAMRARGAEVTDIVILVVAADDGVKPQTKEAIDHAKAAKVPMIVFVNKMDKPGASFEKVMTELAANDVVAEEWGGNIQFVKGSGLTGDGIDELFETIGLQSEMLELKANPDRQPIGTVVESRVDKGRGTIATIIVENGTLHARDFIVAGSHYGRIRTMQDSMGQEINEAGPGTPVVITGLNYTPDAGDKFFGFIDEKFAKKLADEKSSLDKKDALRSRNVVQIEDGVRTYNIIVKADVQGTSEAVKHSLAKLENDEAKVNIIRSSVGMITKSDIILAEASNATIYGFNIRATSDIKKIAEESGVIIKSYSIIYKMIEDVEQVIKGMQAPKFQEKIIGEAIIKQIIFYSKVGNIAGSLVNTGSITSDAKVRLIREGRVIYDGELDSLQRGKDMAKKVEAGKEFGCHIKNFNDIKEGDIIEAYVMEEIES